MGARAMIRCPNCNYRFGWRSRQEWLLYTIHVDYRNRMTVVWTGRPGQSIDAIEVLIPEMLPRTIEVRNVFAPNERIARHIARCEVERWSMNRA